MRTTTSILNHFLYFINKYVAHSSILICLALAIIIPSCTKNIEIEIPPSAEQVVVEGTIETDAPPIVILTKSAKFFDNININNLGAYFIHGAQMSVVSSNGSNTQLVELCLQNLNLPAEQAQQLLGALGFTNVDSSQIPDVCVYTVPDIASYFISGNCSFMGQERTGYTLNITSPGILNSDSIKLSASTYIPTAIGMDSLTLREHSNPDYRDSMMGLTANISVPDTFGNFVRYFTKTNQQPYYKPMGGSVYDDKLFIGLSLGLPLERGQAPGSKFDINTDSYYYRGDTIKVKWTNIDSKTYDFYYTLENDGGNSPFSSPVKIKTNINGGLGIWAGYATKYYTQIIPKL